VFDGLSVASAGTFNNIDDGGTNGGIAAILDPGEFLNASQASGATSGLVGKAILGLIRLD